MDIQERGLSQKLYTLGKKHKIKSGVAIKSLMKSKHSAFKYPLKVLYQGHIINDGTVRILVSVPKKRIKSAVDRNRIKRLIREAFRLSDLNIPVNQSMDIGFIYVGNKVEDFKTVQKSIVKILKDVKATFPDNLAR
jgi:ribonuclease P protein component